MTEHRLGFIKFVAGRVSKALVIVLAVVLIFWLFITFTIYFVGVVAFLLTVGHLWITIPESWAYLKQEYRYHLERKHNTTDWTCNDN